ncbi:MAG: methyltransferase domain-containing protein [Halothiobacillaceae bacterium]
MPRSLASYDALPYDSRPIALTRPDTLAARAALLGANPADPQTARVLELGCASGGNLIPMAMRFPEARFFGVDLSKRQVADGQQRITSLGLTNLTLEHADILDWSPPAGTFDYIIGHGVFSWVPEPVRMRILALCEQKLSPRGIAFISFNTLPGFHLRAITRDMLRDADRPEHPAAERIQTARAWLDDLDDILTGREDLEAQLLCREIHELRGARDSYLLHEYLAECNTPYSVRTFAQTAETRGLAFLGEADLSTLSLLDLDPDPEGFDAQSLLAAESTADQARLRPFRQSILCRAEARKAPNPLAMADALHWQAELQETEAGWMDPAGRELTPDTPWLAEALAQLAQAFPGSCDTRALLAQPEDAQTRRNRLGQLLGLAAAGILRPATTPQPPATPVVPRLTALAREELADGQTFVSSLATHAPIELDRFSRALLTALDQSADLDDLLRHLAEAVRTDPVMARETGLDSVDAESRDALVAANAERLLAVFARHAVLEPSTTR